MALGKASDCPDFPEVCENVVSIHCFLSFGIEISLAQLSEGFGITPKFKNH